ncbi:MAG: PEP-CTERM/exosortase system-associated acyltransferase [Chromatiales bacterium]|jgi:N-acyl amino acid synthase of PEP-CTERM/exosortase system
METAYFSFAEVFPGTAEYELYQQLRYEVFVEELHRIDASEEERSRQVEYDDFDDISRHILASHKETGRAAACVRLILPKRDFLSIETRYEIDRAQIDPIGHDHVAEISRMAISHMYRRRQEDQGKPPEGDPSREISEKSEASGNRTRSPELVLGMYREIFAIANEIDIHCAMAAMEPLFFRLLKQIGLPFRPVGELNRNVEPPRRPYIICSNELEKDLGERHPDILDFMRCRN